MQEILLHKLYEYIRENNPDLLVKLEEQDEVTNYLNEKVTSLALSCDVPHEPAYILEERYLNLMTQDLRPSKYNYIKEILLEEFEPEYMQWQKAGILKFELINLLQKCNSAFDEVHFSENNEDDQFLKYLIIGTIGEYLEENVTVSVK